MGQRIVMGPAVASLGSELVEWRSFGGIVWGKGAAPCKGTGCEPVLLHSVVTPLNATVECRPSLRWREADWQDRVMDQNCLKRS